MGADEIVAGIMLALIVGAFVLDAVLPEKPAPRATWPDYLGEDLPPVPVARVVDPPPLEWDVVTGEIIEPPDDLLIASLDHRALGDGR